MIKFWQSTVGKKAIAALTGLLLCGFVVVHLLGNLLIYFGPEVFNGYAHALQSRSGLVWSGRVLLIALLLGHLVTVIQLAIRNHKARGGKYTRVVSLVNRHGPLNLLVSGGVIALFVIYHILYLAAGSTHPNFDAADPYQNVIIGFSRLSAAIVYIAAVSLLGLHLGDGLPDMLQSLGCRHSLVDRARSWLAVTAGIITAGFVSIPISVLLRLLQ